MVYLSQYGAEKVTHYLKELKAKRKEILDAKKDTATETNLPTFEDIMADIELQGIDSDGFYCNSWGVTDNYNGDPLSLEHLVDFIFVNCEQL